MPYKLPYLRYKLVSQQYTTQNNTLWRDAQGKWLPVSASGEGSALCTDGVIHFYDHPVLAVLFNPVHSEIRNPRLLKIRPSRLVAHDGLKGGCKYAHAVGELPVPSLSRTQWIEFAIRVALRVYKEPSFRKWAHGWLTDKDRSSAVAQVASSAVAQVASSAVAQVASYTTRAAAYAAQSAANAAGGAAYAAQSAANAADGAAYAHYAHYAVHYAADASSPRIFKSVLKIMKLYKLAG